MSGHYKTPARWEDFILVFMAPVHQWLRRFFMPVSHIIVVRWVVGLPGLQLFVLILWLQLTHDLRFCHLCTYPYCCQVSFKVPRVSPSTLLDCDSPLSSTFCHVSLAIFVRLSFNVASLESLTLPFVATYDFPFVSLLLLGHWWNCQVCSGPSCFYGWIWLVNEFCP